MQIWPRVFGDIWVLGLFKRNKQCSMEIRGDLDSQRRTVFRAEKNGMPWEHLWILKMNEWVVDVKTSGPLNNLKGIIKHFLAF